MRQFLNDIKNLKKFCIEYKINFGYDLNANNKYTLVYDLRASKEQSVVDCDLSHNNIILQLYFIKTNHVHAYRELNSKHIIFPIKVKEDDDALHIEELILHKLETHNITLH